VNPERAKELFFCLLAAEARTKEDESGALKLNKYINDPRHRLRPLSAATLAVRLRYLIVVPRPFLRCASQVLDLGVQADARGAARCASPVIDRGAQAIVSLCVWLLDRDAKANARGEAQVLDRGTQAVARSAARCASQVLGRGAQAAASLFVAGS
jgi:hypothetical protein